MHLKELKSYQPLLHVICFLNATGNILPLHPITSVALCLIKKWGWGGAQKRLAACVIYFLDSTAHVIFF